jgi:hypothetical protein
MKIRVWVDNDRLICNGPKGALTPDVRAAISEHKVEILAFLRATGAKARTTELPLQRIPRDGKLPLSFSQQRLWFIDQLEPDTSLYNVTKATRIRGPLRVGSLERSLNEVVRRHEALRTSFSAIHGQPVQTIAPSLMLPLPVVDTSHRVRRLVDGSALSGTRGAL